MLINKQYQVHQNLIDVLSGAIVLLKREFYSQYDGLSKLDVLQAALEKFGLFYNKVSPHQALHYWTPVNIFSYRP